MSKDTFDPLAPFGYDKYGNRRNHWCTTMEHIHEQNIYQQVCLHGIFYNPASKHYGSNTSVACDRCNKKNLEICIGYAQADLCLQCVEELCRKRTINPNDIHIPPPNKIQKDIYGRPKEWNSTPF